MQDQNKYLAAMDDFMVSENHENDFIEIHHSHYQTIISALEKAQKYQWQPIETAPKDEKYLAYSKWLAMKASASKTEYNPNDGIFKHDPKEYSKGHIPLRATHWMPLQEPPTIKGD